MSHRDPARILRGAGLALLLAFGALATVAAADEASRLELRGACYCKTAGNLECLGTLTSRECDRRCAEALCDDWFWLERRSCWNWGYGG